MGGRKGPGSLDGSGCLAPGSPDSSLMQSGARQSLPFRYSKRVQCIATWLLTKAATVITASIEFRSDSLLG